MTWSGWTPEATQQLRDDWAAGISTAEIGRRLGAGKNAIIGKSHRLKLDGRTSVVIARDLTPHVLVKIRNDIAAGRLQKDIATFYHVGAKRIVAIRATMDDAPKPKPVQRLKANRGRGKSPRLSAVKHAEVLALLKAGMGVAAAAIKTDTTRVQCEVVRAEMNAAGVVRVPNKGGRPKPRPLGVFFSHADGLDRETEAEPMPLVAMMKQAAIEAAATGRIVVRAEPRAPGHGPRCTWLFGTDRTNWRACDAPSGVHRSWCDHHHAQVFIPRRVRVLEDAA